MSYTLKLEHPHFPADQEFSLNGLGLVTNGGSLEVDEDQEREFVAMNGRSMEDAFGNTSGITLSGGSSLSAEELKSLLPETPSESESGPSNDSPDNTAVSSPASDAPTTVAATPDTGGEM